MNRRVTLSLIVAVSISIAAVGITRAFGPLFQPVPSALSLVAVVISTWHGGFIAGFVSTVIGVIGLQFLLPGPEMPGINAVRALVFFLASTIVCFGHGALRRSLGQVQRAFSEASALQRELAAAREAARAKAADLKQANEELRRLHDRSLAAEYELRSRQRELTSAYEELREQQEDLTFLLSASTMLSESLDYERNLVTLARLSVPRLGDWCAIDMTRDGDDDDGTLQRLAVHHVNPKMQALLREMDRRYPQRSGAKSGPASVIRTGKELLLTEVPDSFLASIAENEEHLLLLRQFGIRSAVIVPLAARGRHLGAISFFSCNPELRYGLTDLHLAEDLARRAAFCIDNAQLYQQVRTADQRKDEFLATLAHELRNPLAPIMNAFEILRLRVGDHPDLDPLYGTVQRQIQHLTRLINDLVDVSRITRGKIALKRERVRLETLVHQALDTCQPMVESRGQLLKLDFSPDPLWLDADPARIVQVISNLLSNASKYTPPGGCIWLSSAREGDRAVLRVRDNGAGIDPRILSQIFDLFTQGDQSLDRTQGGLGIGLTIVRSIVEHHNGTVRAYSKGLGHGSEFVVHMPIQVGRLPGPETQPAPALVPAGPVRRVLIVEDNPDARETLVRLLELDGHSVLVAGDGPAGLDLILAERPEIALIDVGLPMLDGYQVAKRVRGELGGSVQLVALTGYGNPEDRERAFLSGFDAHLVKPVELDQLRRLLHFDWQPSE